MATQTDLIAQSEALRTDLESQGVSQADIGQTLNAFFEGNQAITSGDLSSSGGVLDLPTAPQTSNQELQNDTQSALDSLNTQIQTTLGQQSAAEQQQTDIVSEFLSSFEQSQGREAAQLEAEKAAGLPEQQKRLQESMGRLQQLRSESLAIPLQIQEEFTGRGATTGGVEPIQTSRLRQNAIQSLSIASQAQALQGNIELAQQQVNRAVDLQFKPIEDRLKYLQVAYTFNKDALERADKKKAQQLEIMLNERTRLLADQKEEQRGIYNVMNTIASYGAPQSVINELRSAKSIDEAISIASPYMQDPAAKQALRNAEIDYRIKQQQLRKIQYENYLLQNPQESTDDLKNIETQRDALTAKVTILDAIKDSSALDSVVGTSFLTRAPSGFFGTVGAVSSIVGIPSVIGGVVDKLSGSRQALIGNVEKLVDKEFLDNLINVKSQGATFGALSNEEGRALRSAATAIGTWRVVDNDGNVVGYDVAEEDFLNEINTIRELSIKAFERSTGETWGQDGFSPDEIQFFNDLSNSATNFNPEVYYDF